MVESEAGFSPDAVGQYQHPNAGQHKGVHIFGAPLIHLEIWIPLRIQCIWQPKSHAQSS